MSFRRPGPPGARHDGPLCWPEGEKEEGRIYLGTGHKPEDVLITLTAAHLLEAQWPTTTKDKESP